MSNISLLSKEHLITCLSSKEGFKNIKSYIAQVEKENEQVYEMLSKGMVEVLASTKIHPLAKLQTLKLFKDIFETAEFNCIEDLDEKIENTIYRVAAYKKDSKEPTRGQTYFIEVEKRADSEQTRQFGMSYHMFALESIKNYAEWYPKDFEGETSRFKEYYDTLKKEGVVFPEKSNYFKLPESHDKFKTNFRKWLKKEEQRQQEEGDGQPSPKQKAEPPKQKPEPKKEAPQNQIKAAQSSGVRQQISGGQVLEMSGPESKQSKISEYPSKIPEAPSRIPEPPSRIPEPPSRIPEPPKQEQKRASSPQHAHEVYQKVNTSEPTRPPALVPTISTVKAEYNEKLQHQLETSVANLQKVRASLESENQKLKGEIADRSKQSEQKLEAQKRETDQIRKKLQQKEAQERSKSPSQPFEEKFKKLEADIAAVNADLTDKNRTIKLNEQRLKELEEQLKKKEATEKELKIKLAEKSQSSPRPATPSKVNNDTLEKVQRQNNELQEKLALSASMVDALQGEKRISSGKLTSLEAENAKLAARCLELEKKLENSLQQSPQKIAVELDKKTPIMQEVERPKQTESSANGNPVKKLPRNEYSVLQPVRSTDKRVHSLPKTEKSGAVTQPNFYAKRVAANLFNATPVRRQDEGLNKTEDWYNRPAKLSELTGKRHQQQQLSDYDSMEKPINNRLSIFGFRDLEGEEITFSPKLFVVNNDILAFRKTCITQQSVFYQNDFLRLKLTRLGGTSEFNLLITNIGKQPAEVQFELNTQAEDYRLTKVEFKAFELLQPGKSLSENFIVKPANMGFRYPNCTVGTKEKLMVIDLPITMLSLCKFLRIESGDKMFFAKRVLKSESFQLDPSVPEPRQFFGKFTTSTAEKQQANCTVSTTFNRDIAVALKMVIVRNRCIFQLCFESTSENCERFARTLLQVLMFCWRMEEPTK